MFVKLSLNFLNFIIMFLLSNLNKKSLNILNYNV